MAFYLKKTRLKGRTYLSIDESFYSHDKKGTAHKCYKSLGLLKRGKKKALMIQYPIFKKKWMLLTRKKQIPEHGKYQMSPLSAILDISRLNLYSKK